MADELLRLFDGLERQRAGVLGRTSGMGAERLGFCAGVGVWSLLDVMDHLVKVEEATLADLRRNIDGTRKVELKERVGVWAVLGVMWSPMRIKVPAGVSMVLPERGCAYDGVTGRWETVRGELRGVAASATVEQMRVGVMRHPVCGWMTLPSAFRFLRAHVRHHEYQMERIEAASRAAGLASAV